MAALLTFAVAAKTLGTFEQVFYETPPRKRLRRRAIRRRVRLAPPPVAVIRKARRAPKHLLMVADTEAMAAKPFTRAKLGKPVLPIHRTSSMPSTLVPEAIVTQVARRLGTSPNVATWRVSDDGEAIFCEAETIPPSSAVRVRTSYACTFFRATFLYAPRTSDAAK